MPIENTLIHRLRRLVLKGSALYLIVLVAVVSPHIADADGPAGNLTRNWSLEHWGGAYADYNGFMLQVAEEWTRFNTFGEEARFMNDHEYAGAFSNSGAVERHSEGNYAQTLWLGHPFIAGIYQQIPAVPGLPYTAKAWSFIAVGSTVSNPDNKILVQIGIDPHGGTDANKPQIVWGDYDGRQKAWPDWKDGVRTAAYAAAPTITLFVRVINVQGEVKPDWNAVWLDAIACFQAPTVSASAPEQSVSPSFDVTVVSAQAAPDGTLTGDYDIQVKDGLEGRWRTWISKKSPGPHTYTGEPGHTYYFRARAWQSYEGINLYGAWNTSPEGDARTTVG